MEKITTRVNSWSAKHLSFAGRLQLVLSVLQGVVNYRCLHFTLPKQVIISIECKCLAFLSLVTNSSKGANEKWDQVCTQKEEGGLGLKKIEGWNKSCFARLIWLIFVGADTF